MASERSSHQLTGFPAAATTFVSALDGNRHRIARRAGVTGTELRALFHIARETSITPKDLAALLGITTGAVTAIGRRLVDLDLLRRVDHPDDRRSLYLELTTHGHDVMGQIHSEFNEMLAASTASLDPHELEAFSRSLIEVARQVRSRSQELDEPDQWASR